MDGNLAAGYDAPLNWVDAWNTMLLTNDLVNPNTGVYDPRHMYGVTNQDVFRWPAIHNGTDKMLLGHYITTLHMPGIPMMLWGEEQAFYVLDNTASNYIFGRQAMSSAVAWEVHGCYSLGSQQYYQFPLDSAARGCNDDWNALDHRDPTSPVRNIIKSMYQMREQYPVLNDGYFLQQLSNQTRDIYLPGSDGVATETGMWSTVRGIFEGVQDLSGQGKGNQAVWLVYQNDNATITYQFDCKDNASALISPFDANTTVKNLFAPFDEYTLEASPVKLGLDNSTKHNGCLSELDLPAWGFKALVPKANWVGPAPMLTKFIPGHDARVQSTVAPGKQESLAFELHFSTPMDCESVTKTLTINSTTEDDSNARLDSGSVQCLTVTNVDPAQFVGGVPTAWTFKANLVNVSNGIHSVMVNNVTSGNGTNYTNSVDHLLFRIGQPDNPMVFPKTANYTRALLHQADGNGTLWVSHKAAGADKFRYSLNWGSSYSDWEDYTGGTTTLAPLSWTGTKLQNWTDAHVMVQYWSRLAGSSDHIQHADLNRDNLPPRRFPHLFMHGPFNQYGYDAGLANELQLDNGDGMWKFNFMTEWPADFELNVWGMNPDGSPDQTFVYGDVDGDSILDRMPPNSLAPSVINITAVPPSPYLAWQMVLNDGNYRFQLLPVGSRWDQLVLYMLLALVPVMTGAIGIWAFMKSFYAVKFNQVGITDKEPVILLALRRLFKKQPGPVHNREMSPVTEMTTRGRRPMAGKSMPGRSARASDFAMTLEDGQEAKRRTVLIATLEYDIEDWAIKIKIGGLGVMAQLMGKNLSHQDLIWVVPCVGGIDYPEDEAAEPMSVTVLGLPYDVKVQYHTLRNITYVLLDAPVFRQQTKAEPYPPRMDDLDSAIFYSAWNQCIAQAILRFPIDLYHINDYHGCVAPVHILPRTIPVCLSLHNAEFQGLWPMRTPKEHEEVCKVYNLEPAVVQKYVQFGDVFNLLHAGASYLRVHQKGFGAVGVSKKYGKRSYARYPIFWGLNKIGQLPNPDPTDTGEWNKELPKEGDIKVDAEFEAGRGELKRQAQEWAGLDQNPDADLLVFVGRWSVQKGVDLIADCFPAILDENPKVQLICVGPVIDLYGRFAATKLAVMMTKYPGRVYSKPEFTALPPYIFSGAEFALIPSRDEPFGLVAVEFGRKGALGIGARVGGLGQMPGWWYTVESTTTTHLIHQFKMACREALASKPEVRAMMRARSAKQRFPVAQWVEDLETLQSTAIKVHQKEGKKADRRSQSRGRLLTKSGANTPTGSMTPRGHSRNPSYANSSAPTSRRPSLDGRHVRNKPSVDTRPSSPEPPLPTLSRQLSLGMRAGPGHVPLDQRLQAKAQADPESIGLAISGIYESSDEEEEGEEEESQERADEYMVTPEQAQASRDLERMALPSQNPTGLSPGATPMGGSPRLPPYASHNLTPDRSAPVSPDTDIFMLPPTPRLGESGLGLQLNGSELSLDVVVGGKKDFKLQKVDPFFTDSTGEYLKAFEKNLESLNAKTSENQLCIEEYLVKSEHKWFDRYRDAKLGKSPLATPSASRAPSIFRSRRNSSSQGSIFNENLDLAHSNKAESIGDQFLLGNDYKPPTGLRYWLSVRYFDWPVYSFFLAFGQIISANSYQITLLEGSVGQSAEKLYVVASIYLVTSMMWWAIFRKLPSLYVLSLPFLLYGLAFTLIGLTPFVHSLSGRGWVQNIATAMYATASSSGSIYFALNFGDEGGAPIKSWIFRACSIQGTQQLYVVALWYWGSTLTKISDAGLTEKTAVASTWVMTAITIPIAILLWSVGLIVYFGLPTYYRQAPGKVPTFYTSLFRRKIISWFFIAVLIQNYFLSAPYGRNWEYLWNSQHTSAWQVFLLVLLFFVGVWAAWLWLFAVLSKGHSWILPIFAIGLGAPRWCQLLWGTSNIGLYVPWAGSPVASTLAGRSLWLWLGVLDSLQGVGFGMILLQTLTRIHISFTLIAAQVLGSIATILARASAPNNIGPGDVFPDFSAGFADGLSKPWFWVALAFQLLICVGFFMFFRKEQLSKP